MVSSWILRLLTGVAVLLSANALQVPMTDEGLQESQIDLETQVKDLQKNVSDLWVYIYDLRHAMEHHLTHLSQHQKIVEGLVYRMTHQDHHGHSDSHHTDDHNSHNDSGHRHDAHHHESESMHDHHDQHADHVNADQQHHHDHHSSSENLHDHGSSDSGHHHTSHSDTDHHDDHHNDDHHHGDEHHQETSDHDHHHDDHQASGGHDHYHSDEHQTSGGHDHHHSDEHQTSGGHDHHHSNEHQTSGGHDHHHSNEHQTSGVHDHHHSDEHQTSGGHDHHHSNEHQTSDSHDHHHGDEHHTFSTHDHHGHQTTSSHEHHSDHDEHHNGSQAHKDSHENQHDHKDSEKQGSLEDQQTQVVEEPIVATSHIHHGQSGHNRLSQTGGNDPLNLLGKHHHHHHHNYHHRHFPKHSQNVTTVSVPKTSDYLLYDFALCEVDANRAIPEEQQQNVKGYVSFWQKKSGGPLNIHLRLQGFKVGDHQQHQMHDNEATAHVGGHRHGFHVHASGDLSTGCQSTGPHYNPLNMNHGGPRSAVRHVGDLGNIECDDQGVTNILFSDDVASLSGNYSILGRAIVIHADEDDYGLKQGDPESLLTGNAGIRIACCVIQKVDKLPLKYYKAMKSATQYRN